MHLKLYIVSLEEQNPTSISLGFSISTPQISEHLKKAIGKGQ